MQTRGRGRPRKDPSELSSRTKQRLLLKQLKQQQQLEQQQQEEEAEEEQQRQDEEDAEEELLEKEEEPLRLTGGVRTRARCQQQRKPSRASEKQQEGGKGKRSRAVKRESKEGDDDERQDHKDNSKETGGEGEEGEEAAVAEQGEATVEEETEGAAPPVSGGPSGAERHEHEALQGGSGVDGISSSGDGLSMAAREAVMRTPGQACGSSESGGAVGARDHPSASPGSVSPPAPCTSTLLIDACLPYACEAVPAATSPPAFVPPAPATDASIFSSSSSTSVIRTEAAFVYPQPLSPRPHPAQAGWPRQLSQHEQQQQPSHHASSSYGDLTRDLWHTRMQQQQVSVKRPVGEPDSLTVAFETLCRGLRRLSLIEGGGIVVPRTRFVRSVCCWQDKRRDLLPVPGWYRELSNAMPSPCMHARAL